MIGIKWHVTGDIHIDRAGRLIRRQKLYYGGLIFYFDFIFNSDKRLLV